MYDRGPFSPAIGDSRVFSADTNTASEAIVPFLVMVVGGYAGITLADILREQFFTN
nr:hypothetical protein [Halobacterium salinarum]